MCCLVGIAYLKNTGYTRFIEVTSKWANNIKENRAMHSPLHNPRYWPQHSISIAAVGVDFHCPLLCLQHCLAVLQDTVLLGRHSQDGSNSQQTSRLLVRSSAHPVHCLPASHPLLVSTLQYFSKTSNIHDSVSCNQSYCSEKLFINTLMLKSQLICFIRTVRVWF